MLYKPDPFFEAESVGPQITFGVTTTELSVDPATIYGAGWDKPGYPYNPARKAYLSQFPEAKTDAEAQAEVDAELTSMEQRGQEYAWTNGGITVRDKSLARTPGAMLALAGVGVAAAVGLALWGGRSRTVATNPRRPRWLPLASLAGVGAAMWYASRRSVEALERAVEATEGTP